MHDLLKECIYNKNQDIFNELEDKANAFIDRYVGHGAIIQDDIFSIIKVYSKDISIIRFPIPDYDICGFICKYKGRIFIYINTFLPLEKQIYTAAHELYHLVYNNKYLEMFSNHLIKEKDLESSVNEEQRANLFAALLLVPAENLKKKIETLNIDCKDITKIDIIKLMDAFAVPYKTIILRLYEIGIIDEQQANQWLGIPDRDMTRGILYEIHKYEIGLRWQRVTEDIHYDELKSLIINNDDEELITVGKAKKDRRYIENNMITIFEKFEGKVD